MLAGSSLEFAHHFFIAACRGSPVNPPRTVTRTKGPQAVQIVLMDHRRLGGAAQAPFGTRHSFQPMPKGRHVEPTERGQYDPALRRPNGLAPVDQAKRI